MQLCVPFALLHMLLSTIQTSLGLRVQWQIFLSDFEEFWIVSTYIFINISDIKFHYNLSSFESRGRTDTHEATGPFSPLMRVRLRASQPRYTEWPQKMYTLFTHQYLWNKFK